MFKNVKIGTRLYLGFGLMILFLVLTAILSISSLNTLKSKVNYLSGDCVPKTVFANNIINQLNINARSLRNAILAKDAKTKQEEIDKANAVTPIISANLDSLKHNIDTDKEKEILKELLEARENYIKDRGVVFDLIMNGNNDEAVTILFGDLRKSQASYLGTLSKLAELEAVAVTQAGKDAESLASTSTIELLVIAGIALLIAILIAVLITKGIVKPIMKALDGADKIADGDFNSDLTTDRKDETGHLLVAMAKMKKNVQNVVEETNILSTAAINGKLDTRADATKFKGEYKALVQGINGTLDAVIGPLNVAAEYMDRISKGDIPPLITDEYKGDFNEIKNNLNVCMNAIRALVADAKLLSSAAIAGKLDTRANANNHQGDFKLIIEGFNGTLDAVIGPLNVAAEYVDRISKGDTPPMITDEYNGDFNEIKNNLNQCISAVAFLVDQTGVVIEAATLGKLDVRLDVSKAQGFYRKIMLGMNETLDAVISPLNIAAEYVDRISKGDLPPKITDEYKGDFNEIKNNLNQCIDNIQLLVKGVARVSNNVQDGDLKARGNTNLFTGDWKVLAEEINRLIESFVLPINTTAVFLDEVANGKELQKITEDYKGDFNITKNNINTCIDVLYSILGDTSMLAEAAVNGKLDVRADLSKYKNAWFQLVKGVNDTLDAVVGPLNVAAEYVDRISKGDIPPLITDDYKGDFNEIKNNLNVCMTAIRALVSDAKMLSEAAIAGKLDTRANASIHQGDFKAIVEGFNGTLDAVIGPLNVAAEYMDRIAKGDIPPRITDNYNGDFNEIKNNLNTCIDAVNLLVSDTKMLSKSAIEGKLDTRADASKHQNEFKAIVEGINGTLDAVIGPLNVAAEYMDRIAKGDIPPRITDNYNGDFNEIKNNLNTCIDAVNLLVSDTKMLSKSAIEGKLDTRADASKHQNEFKAIVEGINGTLDAVIGPLNVAAEYMDRIAKGDIPPRITDNYNGDFNEIKNNLNTCIDAVNLLVSDTKMLSKSAIEGKLDTRADASKHQNEFKAIVEGINGTLDAVIGPLNVAAEYMDRIAKGDIPPRITDNYNGDFNEIKNNLNTCIDAVNLLVKDAQSLANSAVEGKLAARADASKHQNEFRAIVEGINKTLDNIVEPVNDASKVLGVLAAGDFTARMDKQYQGDHENLKRDINHLADSLGSVIRQVSETTLSVSSASVQIASTADTMASAAHEQSSQADEVASAVEEMSRTVTENALNAQQTAKMAESNGNVATGGGIVVKDTVKKMRQIADAVGKSAETIERLGVSSAQIGEIISVIDDIADQTNLLALNAAIEAARAGEQGRGFAVVAEEVRKLAERTTQATKQIATMIKGIQNETQEAVKVMNQGSEEVKQGIILADKAGESLEEIVNSSHELQTMISKIAYASEEQSSTSEEISKNVASISHVTNESSKRIEDVARSAEEMAKLTEQLSDLMDQFKVEDERSLPGQKNAHRLHDHKTRLLA